MDLANICKCCELKKDPKDRCPNCCSATIRLVPVEIWTIVFSHLDVVLDLLSVRRTCRSWKQIVDGSRSLRDRFRVYFAGKGPMDAGGYRPVILPAAHAEVACCEIGTVVLDWWSEFARGLVSLEVNCCGVSLGALLGMLRQTGNLKELALVQVYYLETEKVADMDFRMDQLERLDLHNCSKSDERQTNVPAKLLDLFCGIFVRLKHFAIDGDWDKKKVRRVIEINESTLEEIRFDATNKPLRACSMMKQLNLKKVGIFRIPKYNSVVLGFFFKSQRHVTDLTVDVTSFRFLCVPEFRQLKLTHLRINLRSSRIILCTLEMPTLKYLEISGYSNAQIDFSGCKLTTIEELSLDQIRPTDNSLTNYLSSCPRLQALKLKAVSIGNNMSLAFVRDPLDFLQTLTIYISNMSRRVLLQLIQLAPNLKNLELRCVFCVNDDTILRLIQAQQNLRRLTISCNQVTEESVDHIIHHHGEHLRHLVFDAVREYGSESARQKLLDHFTPRRCRVEFSLRYSHGYRN